MASETFVSLPDASDEKIDKKVDKEKKIEELANPAAPLPEVEKSVEEKPIVPPVVEEVEKIDLKVEETPEEKATEQLPVSALPKVEEKMEEKPTVDPVVEVKTEVVPEEKPEEKANEKLPAPVTSLPEVEEKVEEKPIVTPSAEEVVNTAIKEDKPEAEEKIEDKPLVTPSIEEVVNTAVKEETPEVEEKIEDKPLATPVVEEVVQTDIIEEKPVVEEIVKIDVNEEKQDREEKPSVTPVVEETVKTDIKPEVGELVEETLKTVENTMPEDPVEEKVKVAEDPIPVVETSDVAEKLEKADEPEKSDATAVVIEEKIAVSQGSVDEMDSSDVTEAVVNDVKPAEPVQIEPLEQPATESVENEPAVEPTNTDTSELSSVEIIEKPENPLEAPPVKAQESIVAEDKEVAVKPGELVEEVQKPEITRKDEDEGVTDKKVEEKAAPADKVTVTEEEKIISDKEPSMSRSLEQLLAMKDEVSDEKIDAPLSANEKIQTESIVKEPDVVSVVDELPKEAPAKTGIVEEGNENTLKEGIEDKNVIETTTEPTKVEDSSAGVGKEPVEGENTSRDVELVGEIKDTKYEKPVLEESKKDDKVEEKLAEDVTPKEKVDEARDFKLDPKEEETVKATAEETDKLDETNPDPSSKVEDEKIATQDQPDEAKPNQKQSNSILSKVKKGLVKAKKAIIGKSPTPKAPSPENKVDG